MAKLADIRGKVPELEGLDDQQALEVIHQVYYPTADKSALASRLGVSIAKPVQAEEQGDVSRGFKTAMLQVPQTAGGALALVGDAVGADGLRDYGMSVYENNSRKIADISKESDSLSNVLEGDASAADWLQYAAGYTGGQALQAIATGGLGGMIGSQLAKRGIREVVARGAQSAMAKQVAGKVATTGAKIGAGSALLGTNLVQEAGSIYPEALEQAKSEGRELDGGDLTRVGVSAAGAAAVDTAMDAVMLGRVMRGGRKAGEGMARAAVREVPAAMGREAVTEGIQTGIERYGAGKELSTADAIREYVDSAGIGAVGGGMGGGVSVLNTQKVPESGPLTKAANAGIDEQIKLLANDPDPLVAFPDGSVGTKTELHMYLQQFDDPEERIAKERELMGRDPKTGKRVEPEPGPEPTAADNEANSDANIKAWSARHDPVDLDYAQNLIKAPGAKGMDLMIAPHASGKGYTVVPSKWLSLDAQAKAMALQKGDAAKLPGPDRELPDARMIVDSEGGAAPETYGDATRAEQGRQKLAAEAKRREELGTPVPYGTKATPKPAKPILAPSGMPFKSKRAAINAQRAQSLGESHDIQEVAGGFVLQPKAASEPDLIDQAAHEAATSKENDLPQPTEAQKEAGNYKKAHVSVQGLNISIENPRGSERSGKRPDGTEWRHTMSDHYGYLKRTTGADGEQVDVYVGPKPESERVFVVDQLNQDDGSFDEHKAMLGYGSQRAAITAYKSNFDKGWKVGPVKSMTMDEFKDWLKNGDTTKPVAKAKPKAEPKSQDEVKVDAGIPASFTDRADANAAMLKTAEETGQVHEVVELADGKFEVKPVQENADASDDGGRSDQPAAGNEPADGQRPDGDRHPAGQGRADAGELGSKTVTDPVPASEPADRQPALKQDAPREEAKADNPQATPEPSPITPDAKTSSKAVRMTPLAHPGLDNPDIRAELEIMSDEAGWDQIGGRMLREVADDPNSRVVGRTSWIPKHQWYADLPERLNEADTVRAVNKALAGKPMSAKEKRVISNMLDFAQARIQEMTNYYEEKAEHEADYRDAIEALDALPDRDLDVLIEGGSTDTAEMMRALGFTEEEIAHEIQGQGRQGTGKTAARITQEGDQRSGNEARTDEFSLQGEAIEEGKRRVASEDHRKKDEDATRKAAEKKAKVDAEVSEFKLTGSDRHADANPDQLDLLGKQSSPSTAAAFDQSLYDDIGQGKSSTDILTRIAKESDNKLNREMAQALLDAGIAPKITQETAEGKRFTVGNAPQGYAFAAAYSPKTDTVMLFRPEEAERNTLHEMVHAGSFKALRKGGQSSVAMKQLYQHVKKSGQAGDAYGMSNLDEFTAEALSNPEFQDMLRSITAMPEGSKFANAWNWFVDIVRRALGLPTKYFNALDQALRYGRGLMTENGAAVSRSELLGNVDKMTPNPLTEKQFYAQYSQHVDIQGARDGTSEQNLQSILENGFKTGYPVNTLPPYQGGQPSNVVDKQFAKYGGKVVYLVPKSGMHKVRGTLTIKNGWKPMPYEVVRPTHDYAPMYQEYLKAFNEWAGKQDGGTDGDVLGNVNRDTAQAIGNGIKSVSLAELPHKAGNRLKDFRGLGLQALGRRQILDIYRDDFTPEGKPSILAEYNELAQRMDADKNEAGAQADGIADRWGKLKDERELAELMHDATLAQIDPEKDYQPGDNRGQWTGLRNRYNALSAEAKAIYKQARNAYTDHWMAVRAEIKNRIERTMPESPRRARMLERMDDEFFKKIKGVYFPLARFGDYLVTVKGADGKTESVNFAETLNEAEKLRAELVKKFPKDKGFMVGKVQKRREFNAARDAVGRGFLQELFGLLDQSGVADELQDSINQLYLSSLPDLSWAKHGIHRKGTPGFSQDARRAFAQNMFHGARYLAKLRYADRMADKLTDMQDHVDSKAGDEDYDSVAAQQVVDEMNKRHDAYMNPKTSPLSTTLTSLGFIFYLGLSPASAVVNLSQTPLVTLPMLAAKYGYGKASAALLAASKQAAGNRNDISKALNGDELRAFNEAVKSGVIDVSMAHDLAGIASGEDTKTHAKLRPVMKWASFLFHHGEKFNRQATMMAAYRLAREAGQNHEQAYESAVKMTYDSHYDYSAGNRPRIMQGDVARVVLLFKQFAQNSIYNMTRNAYLAAKGDKQALKIISGLLLSHAMAAGVLGLPVVGTLLSIASAIGSDEDDPWDAKVALRNALADAIGQKPAEVLVHGLSRLTPFDISGRVGLDKLILPDVYEGLEGARAAEAWMGAMLGPIAGIGINTAKGLQHIAEGDYSRGMESILPAALRGPVKAIRYAGDGVKDKTGIVITEDTTALEELGQALGFSPSRVREANEGKSAVYQADRRLLDRRQALMTQWAHARMAGDAEGAAEVQELIKRFNERNPSRKITPVNLNQSLRNRQRRIEQAEQGVYLPSKRRDVQDVGRFAADQ